MLLQYIKSVSELSSLKISISGIKVSHAVHQAEILVYVTIKKYSLFDSSRNIIMIGKDGVDNHRESKNKCHLSKSYCMIHVSFD